RHVINVFWLGYCLIHNDDLTSFFESSWRELRAKRSNMQAVYDMDPLEALSNAWFVAGLFHDIGGCIEKAAQVTKKLAEVLSVFGSLAPDSVTLPSKKDILLKKAVPVFSEFDDNLPEHLENAFAESLERNEPDQGIVAAIHLRDSVKSGPGAFY